MLCLKIYKFKIFFANKMQKEMTVFDANRLLDQMYWPFTVTFNKYLKRGAYFTY